MIEQGIEGLYPMILHGEHSELCEKLGLVMWGKSLAGSIGADFCKAL